MNFWKKEENSIVLTEVDEKEFMVMFLHRVFGKSEQEDQNNPAADYGLGGEGK